MAEKKGRGRQKIEMKKMDNESNLMVTFSKRKAGLFKKASELCTLCGAETAVILASPGNKIYSFGHPSVEIVVDRYLSPNPTQISPTTQGVEAHRDAHIRGLNRQLNQVTDQLEIEKKRGEELKQMREAGKEQFWWQKPIDELDFSQLQQFKTSLEHLRKKVTMQADELLGKNNPLLPNDDDFTPDI
ncbi:agamous-like MADS-box protein AGL62 [Euphorbia lathyris]|uniref:agamous-like MADS-box protein AGL62 n=1 Tax=Euphorbia lathyris TaxID=212925 RepID=UPI0033139E14